MHLRFSYFVLGVTSRDLSMTVTLFLKFGRKWTVAPKLLGLEWCNLGKSQVNVFSLGLFFFFSSTQPLTLAQCQPTRTRLYLSGI